MRLSPKSVQTPWPEIRVAAASPDTYVEVAELGHPIFVAARIGNLSDLAPHVKNYRRAWKKAGHPGKGQIFLRVPVYVAETEEAAIEEPRESIMHLLRYIGDRLTASAGAQGTRAIENRAERGAKMQNIDYDEVLRERMIVGTPAARHRSPERAAGHARPRRHPGRAQPRQPHPASAGDDGVEAAV